MEAYDLYDSSLNEEMRKGFDVVLADNQRAVGHPLNMI